MFIFWNQCFSRWASSFRGDGGRECGWSLDRTEILISIASSLGHQHRHPFETAQYLIKWLLLYTFMLTAHNSLKHLLFALQLISDKYLMRNCSVKANPQYFTVWCTYCIAGIGLFDRNEMSFSDKVIEALVRSLCSPNYSILLSVHPKTMLPPLP